MNRPPNTARAQAGVMLLEALIGILIFSLGILSLVALQATSIQLTSDAKYRTDASLLANRLIGQMWASGLAPRRPGDRF
jgi:type IV pilus assembly protein PilV